MPLLGWYGDDFTGATDTLACLAEAGLRTMLFPRVPSAAHLAAAGPLDALGIAGATRAMAPDAMSVELAPVARFFAASGVRVLHYKCCSTFDSAPGIGSIGAAVRCLREHFPNPLLPILGGQPNIGRYCLFSHLFASAGSGAAVHRLDRHPTMSVHPVTPMPESDLRRHLHAQGLGNIAAIHYPAYEAGADRMAALLDELLNDAPSAILMDIARQADLALIGELLWAHAQRTPMLAVGPSSVAQSLAAVWSRMPAPKPAPLARADGPVFVMVGSLSPVSRAQAEASPSYVHLEISGDAMQSDGRGSASVLERAVSLLRDGRSVMLRTAPPDITAVTQQQALAIARASADLVRRVMHEIPLRRIGIAGGDTSSHTALALDIWALAYRRTLAPGVTLCALRSDVSGLDGLEVMFKGGQMGPPTLFETLVHGTAG
jgi:uncharacterized protein YgbK (DUF1537 family)